MTEPGTRSALSTPVTSRRPRISVDPDAVGRYSEAIARFFGTGQYLLIQTILVIVWILINVTVVAMRFDPYPFILLNLAFSTQAAYAAPPHPPGPEPSGGPRQGVDRGGQAAGHPDQGGHRVPGPGTGLRPALRG